jgi:hypothetical protein
MDDENFDHKLKDALASQRTEADFLRICGLYRAGTEEQRARIRGVWSTRWKVPSTSGFSLKDRSIEPATRIAAALIFASIENLRMDARDTLVNLCAAWHAAGRAGLDARALFEEARALSAPEFAQLAKGFLDRKPENRSLSAFGWTDFSTEERILYKWG